MTNNVAVTCTQNACNGPRGGECLEGLPFVDCKFATIIDPATIGDPTDTDGLVYDVTPGLLLATGEDLDIADATKALRDYPTRLVMIAGQPESGKTTLVTQIYEYFNKGPFAEYLYAWSDTIPAYERRCFPSRVASERTNAATDRTILSAPKFLHLRVRGQGPKRPMVNMLFSDIKGEVFSSSQLSSTEMRKLTYFARADHIAILVDGAQLVNPRQRHKELADCRTFVRSLIDNDMVPQKPFAQVLFSKWDLVKTSNEEASIQMLLDTFKTDFLKQFSSRLSSISFEYIAARPESDILPLGYNIDDVFAQWVQRSHLETMEWTDQPPIPTPLRSWLIGDDRS